VTVQYSSAVAQVFTVLLSCCRLSVRKTSRKGIESGWLDTGWLDIYRVWFVYAVRCKWWEKTSSCARYRIRFRRTISAGLWTAP